MPISNKVVQKFLDKVPWSEITRKAENAPRGSRLYPTRTPVKDKAYNLRIDAGSNTPAGKEIVMQANINAEDKGVREAAQKNSYATLAKAEVLLVRLVVV